MKNLLYHFRKQAKMNSALPNPSVIWNFDLLPILTYLLICIVSLGFTSVLHAQRVAEKDDDKTLSPYFFVQSDGPDIEQLPLKFTEVEVNIAGVIADVHVRQSYKNEGKKPIEAIYIFPASTRAAVYGMQMTIGERIIVAKIEERKTAREQYEEAKQNGQSASLLEQQRPNMFQMNVANIMPGDIIQVDLYYTELLIPVEKQYTFLYPTVVGPRYSNVTAENAPESEAWVENPYLHEGKAPSYDFDLNVVLNSGVPVKKISSSTHEIDISFLDKNSANITLSPVEVKGGNRDFILNYQLSDKQIQTGLLLFEGEEENFFLAMVQPPERVKNNQVVSREYIFIIDVSGSMNGFPIHITKKLMRDLIANLNPGDKFNVLLFAGGSNLFEAQSVAATESNVKRAIKMIENEPGAGGTELLPALKRAMNLPQSKEFSRSIVILTDGYVSVERESFDLIRQNLGEANVFSFGIGSSVNHYLVEGLARAGLGESFVVTQQSEASSEADRFRQYIQSPVLTNIKVNFPSFDTYDVEPVSIPDVFADRPVLIYGKYRGSAEGSIIIEGSSANNSSFETELKVSQYKSSNKNAALRYLWARNKIAMLSDYNQISQDKKDIERITSLGLQYSLLTEFTSFIAIDTEKRNQTGQVTTVKQPLPLPQGVPQSAVGGVLSAGSGGVRWSKNAAKLTRPAALEEELSDIGLAESIINIEVDQNSKDPQVSKFIHGQQGMFEHCYQKRMNALGGSFLEGEVELWIEFDSNGKVSDVKITDDDLEDSDLVDCIIDKIRHWHLLNYNSSNTHEVTITLTFGITN